MPHIRSATLSSGPSGASNSTMPLTATSYSSETAKAAIPILAVLIVALIIALLQKYWLPYVLPYIQPLRHRLPVLEKSSKYITSPSSTLESSSQASSSRWNLACHYSTRHLVYVAQTCLLSNAILASVEAGCYWDLDDREFGALRAAERLEWSIGLWVNNLLEYDTQKDALSEKSRWTRWFSSSDFAISWCPRVVYGSETGSIIEITEKKDLKAATLTDLEKGELPKRDRTRRKPSVSKVEKLLYRRERLCSDLRKLHVLVLEQTVAAQHTKPQPSLHSSTNSQDSTSSFSTQPFNLSASHFPLPSSVRTIRPQLIDTPSPSIGKAITLPAKPPRSHSSSSRLVDFPPPHSFSQQGSSPSSSHMHTRPRKSGRQGAQSRLQKRTWRYTQFPPVARTVEKQSGRESRVLPPLASGGLAGNSSVEELRMAAERQLEGPLPVIKIRPTTWGRLNVDTLDLGLGIMDSAAESKDEKSKL